MATAQAGILRHIRELVAAEQAERLSDGQLLEQFTAAHEEAAFEALVKRHGPLVLGVCQRVLGNAADAEDAFQAAFLVLARKAHAIRNRDALSSWLSRVAYHTALRARRQAAARRQHELQAGQRAPADPFAELTGRELLSVLDEEVQRLPERYRAPLVHCYLEGLTCDEAGQALGWPVRTLKRRLEQGRERLRSRLAHRGLALPAALLTAGLTHGAADATLPARLTEATVRSAVQAAAGKAPAVVAATAAATTLAQGVLTAMLAARLKLVAAVVLVAGLIVLGAGALAHPAGASTQSDPPAAPGHPPRLPQKKAETGDEKSLTAAGRVLGADGKPLAGAEVALVGWWRTPAPKGPATEVLARGRTDDRGRFHLSRKGASPGQFYDLHVLASGKGFGLAWLDVRARVRGQTDQLELKLQPEQILRGRLFDLQGVPAKGVKGRVVYVARKFDPSNLNRTARMGEQLIGVPTMGGRPVTPPRTPGGFELRPADPPPGLALWPRTFTTDAEGRFESRGFASGAEVHLLIEDERFARQELQAELATKPPPKEVTLSLAPPRRIEGRLVYEDTGKPVAGAELWVTAFRSNTGKDAFTRTDAQGRFTANPYPGDTFTIRVWPPAGEPYVGLERQLTWPKGAARQSLKVELPRGVTLKGRVVEAPSGKPLTQVRVFFVPRSQDNPKRRSDLLVGSYWPARSGADGSYRLVVPPGPGHLLINADSPDTGADDPNLVTRVVSVGELTAGKPGGELRYFHEALPIDFQVKDDPKELDIKLRRGVTLRGRVVGPDGKPVKRAVLFCGGELLRPPAQRYRFTGIGGGQPGNTQAFEVRDGQFELPACDPERSYRVFLLDVPDEPQGGAVDGMRLPAPLPPLLVGAKGRLGAAVELSAKQAGGEPVTVRLTPCGLAEARVVDDKGKAAKQQLWLELILTPARGKVNPEWALLGGPQSVGSEIGFVAMSEPRRSESRPRHATWAMSPLRPDAEGLLTIPALIPSATYRLRVFDERDFNVVRFERAFTVEPGKTRRLPDIVLAP